MTGVIADVHTVRSGIEYMIALAEWYRRMSQDSSDWFLPDRRWDCRRFPICVVPMLNQDVRRATLVPEWGYFCQISDSTTSFGSYSGAVPNEKITWGKLNIDTPKFISRIRRHDCGAAHIRQDSGLVALGPLRIT